MGVSDLSIASESTRLALDVHRRGGHLSDDDSERLVRLTRRYRRIRQKAEGGCTLSKADQEREREVFLLIPAILSQAGLGGWNAGFDPEPLSETPVVLISPDEEDRIIVGRN